MDKWLKPVFAGLLKNKTFSDCRILVENEAFDCHRVILASSSEFFERLFLSSLSKSVSGEFRLEDVKPETFAKFIEYVYTYDIEKLRKFSNSMIMELLICGNTWLVGSIVSDCKTIIIERGPKMDFTDLVKLYQIAHDINEKYLIGKLVQLIRIKFKNETTCFDVLDLKVDAFRNYFFIAEDFMSEVQRFKMLEYYVTVNGLIDADPSTTPADVGEGFIVNGQMVVPKTSSDDDDQKISEISKNEESDDTDTAENPGTGKANINIKGPRSKYVQTLLGHIKFNTMNKNDFYNAVFDSKLMTLQEKFENLYLTQES